LLRHTHLSTVVHYIYIEVFWSGIHFSCRWVVFGGYFRKDQLQDQVWTWEFSRKFKKKETCFS
jgi:hypothetical protein